MSKPKTVSYEITPFESIRRTNPTGNEFWSSRDFARVLGYVNYRHFQAVIEKARTACFNSGQRVATISSGSTKWSRSGAQRPLKAVMMSRNSGHDFFDSIICSRCVKCGSDVHRLMLVLPRLTAGVLS
jgi:hypothetical protein